jgi:hypothetical protein
MSLFNKYLTIIQEAAIGKKIPLKVPPAGPNKPTLPGWKPPKHLEGMTFPSYYKSEENINLSDKQAAEKAQSKEKQLSEKDILKNIKIEHDELMKEHTLNQQNMKEIIDKRDLSYKEIQKISQSPILSYLYTFYMKQKDKKIDSKNIENLETSILTSPRMIIKYIVNVIGKKWDKAGDLINEIQDNIKIYNFSIEEILNSYNDESDSDEKSQIQTLSIDNKDISKFEKIYPEFS